MQKIDITSTTIEKGIDIAKGFIEKLIYPPVEEMGLLLKDGIAKWRFQNQIKTLIKAKNLCEKHKIVPQIISPKLLCPLLDYASLEDNEKLQDKWATLLANMVDSSQNVENHVFPYLLSQVSIQEFENLEKTVTVKIERIKYLKEELSKHLKFKETEIINLNQKIKEIETKISNRKTNNINYPQNYKSYHELESILNDFKSKKYFIEKKQEILEKDVNQPEFLSTQNLKEFEISNLIRLGVIKEIIRSYGLVEDQKIEVSPSTLFNKSHGFVSLKDLSVIIETENIEYELTKLGEMFVKACQEKKGDFD